MSGAVVYRMFDASGSLLYVGMSTNLPARLASHASDKQWWPEVARISVQHFDGRKAASAEEIRAIAEEQPLHNRCAGSVARYNSAADREEERRRTLERIDAERRERSMYRVPDLSCEHCGWEGGTEGGWVTKAVRVEDVECPNCGFARLTGTPSLAFAPSVAS